MKNINKKMLLTACLASTILLTGSNNSYAIGVSQDLPDIIDASANILDTNPDADTLRIDQAGAVGIIDYNSYNVGVGKSVLYNFDTPGAISINKVINTGTTYASHILGNIGNVGGSQQGHVLLLNPNGVMFGPTASVNLDAFTVSTHQNYTLKDSGIPTTLVDAHTATDWDTLDISGLTKYGIYIANGASINTAKQLNMTTNAFLNKGTIAAEDFNVIITDSISLAQTADFNTNVLPTGMFTIGADVGAKELYDENGNPVTITHDLFLADTSSITANKMSLVGLTNAAYTNPIINLGGNLIANAGDIIVRGNKNINIANSTNITADGGGAVIETTYDGAPTKTGSITAGDDVTITADSINVSTNNHYKLTAGVDNDNHNSGDIAFGDRAHLTADSTNLKIYTGKYIDRYNDNLTFGSIDFGNDAKLKTTSNTGVVNISTAAAGNNSTAGSVEFKDNASITSKKEILIETTHGGTNFTAGDITFGNFADDDIADLHSSGATGNGIILKASTYDENSAAGSIKFGNNVKIESNNNDISISTVAHEDGSTSGNITLGNNTTLISERDVRIYVSGLNSGNVTIGNDFTLNAKDDSRIEAYTESGTAGNITIGNNANITADDTIGLYAYGEGNNFDAGDITFEGSANLIAQKTRIFTYSLAMGDGLTAGDAGNLNWGSINFNSPISGGEVFFATASAAYPDAGDPDVDVVIVDIPTFPNATFGSNITTIQEWRPNGNAGSGTTGTIGDSSYTPGGSDPVASVEDSASDFKPANEELGTKIDKILTAPITDADVEDVVENTDGVFGAAQNNENNSNANSGSGELAQAAAAAQMAQASAGSPLPQTISMGRGVVPSAPQQQSVVSSRITVSPQVPVSNIQQGAGAKEGSSQMQGLPVRSGLLDKIKGLFHKK